MVAVAGANARSGHGLCVVRVRDACADGTRHADLGFFDDGRVPDLHLTYT